jgi:protein-tyrosine-phosphatase
MVEKVYNVLFLCPHDAARGLMAEAILNKVGDGRFHAYSAGVVPNESLHDDTVKMLKKLSYDVSTLHSSSIGDFVRPGAPEMDFIFTVSDDEAGEPCPVLPGQPMTAHWSVAAPQKIEEESAETGLALAAIYKDLHNRIRLLVNLRVDGLDRLSLQHELDTIGSGRVLS